MKALNWTKATRTNGTYKEDPQINVMDPSLKPDPTRKGSYYRRIQDIQRGLDALEVEKLPDTLKFFAYYFGCEKLAYGIVGIHKRLSACTAYRTKKNPLRLDEIKQAVTALGLQFNLSDLEWIFADYFEQVNLQSSSAMCKNSARYLRNKVGHQLGPTHVELVKLHAPFHLPIMRTFLHCDSQVLAYQVAHFSNIP